jgi:hypothetical protein
MARINLDKYYTPPELAKYCIDVVHGLGLEITEYVEPSAGNGSFSLQLPNCKAFDLEPEHESIKKQDFLKLGMSHKKGRLVIGNPPFTSYLIHQFYLKSVSIGDYIAFILPITQYKQNHYYYKFDLIHSEDLGKQYYSGIEIHCCFNVYKRPKNGLNKKPKIGLSDVTILHFKRSNISKNKPKYPKQYDVGISTWGTVGKKIEYPGQFADETYFIINNKDLKERILDVLRIQNESKWKDVLNSVSTPRLPIFKIIKHLKEQIPNIK